MYPSLKSVSNISLLTKFWLSALLILLASFFLPVSLKAQTEVTGAIEGRVTNSQSPNEPVAGASVQIINLESQVQTATKTGPDGRFVKNQLPPGRYKVVVKAQNFKDYDSENDPQGRTQRVDITLTNKVIPVPISLEPLSMAAATPTPSPTEPSQPGVTPTQPSGTTPSTPSRTTASTKKTVIDEDVTIANEINTTDARRGGGFRDNEVSTLPLGGTTLVRSFDELALLLPGVALPPQTQGSVAGPGVGAGVGSSGQFSVNGLRSRANNFTVDGSDDNDEDIGVRRQGFFALVPQPIESIQGFQVITLLAPAQYGRNIGAQVNAVSKSGGNQYHGTIYGFFNSSQLNAANFFDTTSGNTTIALQGRTPAGQVRNVFIDGRQAFVSNTAGNKDSFTLGQGGIVLGGPLIPSSATRPNHSLFFFISAEGHLLNATKEENFAVPTVAQRGIFGTGASGISTTAGDPVFPTRVMGDAIFSLFPFPNNPQGVYRANTYTQALSDSAQGKVVSGKINSDFKAFGKAQRFVARYNFTDDWRDIPVTGGAIFSSLHPRVRTQNISNFLTTEISNSTSNELRLSYGRTRLIFDERRDPSLLPSVQSPNTPFLLNRNLLENNTLPGAFNFCPGGSNTACYFSSGTTEQGDFFSIGTGPLGQVIIAGFSPVGVDVFNFPQRRVNNTYQLADTVSIHRGRHNFAFGADTRRTELNSDLPRNARPLAIFGGTPQVAGATLALSPTDWAATGSPTGFFVTLAQSDSTIHLRYYQLNFFGQDEWRIRPNLSLSYGVRYEYNTVPQERDNRIERTFNDPALSLLPDLRTFIDGRSQIYEPDRNNISPRIGIAYSRNFFGNKETVIRAGYGLYYDQILGAVISQSRNVYPTFLTLNTAGGSLPTGGNPVRDFVLFNPAFSTAANFCSSLFGNCYTVPGTLNTLNAPFFNNVVTFNRDNRVGGFGLTLPERNLQTPMAHQYSITVEQQVSRSLVLSAAYVGTLGRKLLRITTPNLGPNVILVPTTGVFAGGSFGDEPEVDGIVLAPGNRARRLFPTAGSVNIYRSNARSRYDALQVQVRGRFKFMGTTQFQANYTFSSAKDDASDVFDLAGAPALPQDSVTFAGEYAPSNFDARHRISYDYITDLPRFKNRALRFLLGGVQFAATGQFQTGQPFTINSIFDVNLDGNLTDRLNTTQGLVVTGNRRQPVMLGAGTSTASLLAHIGQNGSVPRNSFRAGNIWTTNSAVTKTISFSEDVKMIFRMEIFNVFNRANFGIPVRFLEFPGFGQATDTVTPGRRIQFAVKLDF
jgi:Carboxypeptidase regulatory-like domain